MYIFLHISSRWREFCILSGQVCKRGFNAGNVWNLFLNIFALVGRYIIWAVFFPSKSKPPPKVIFLLNFLHFAHCLALNSLPQSLGTVIFVKP